MPLSKLLLTFCCLQAHSADVYLKDLRIPAEPFAQAGFTVKPGWDAEEKSTLPTVAETSQILRNCGLERDTENWDQVEIDMLLIRAKSWPWKELQVQYPKLKPEGLRALQSRLSR